MQSRTNKRGSEEHYIKNQHLKLEELKKKARQFWLDTRSYIFREDIPPYPHPEFHVSQLKHDTKREALCQIWKDGGFKDPYSEELDQLPLVWWSLAVKFQDIQSAETRLLETTFPKQTEDSVLKKFATSPAFSEKSRYGSYRFTFPLEEVLTAYSEQFCGGEDPVFRVFKTSLYKQEVMYAVLVHRPEDEKDFEKYPKLPAADDMDAVCAYSDGHFIWRAEAMCGSHWFELEQDEENKQTVIKGPFGNSYYYVWDHVAVALHVKNDEVPSLFLLQEPYLLFIILKQELLAALR
ncbi:uncharacterized protein LOC115775475 [Archocentrus centrarchus]|uniref:uncharacterized protein LOC115775475 n=1 Tax=Archocentrus centrarchus TaxID=63155 RepID=UPI0011EA1C97|nr:uncharacterized protein LOC115775475 [Archocentrus centrarchus]